MFPFAIFGIPLFILLVADLAKTFSLLFNWICRIFANCWRKFRKRLSPSQAKEIKLNGKNALSKKINFQFKIIQSNLTLRRTFRT